MLQGVQAFGHNVVGPVLSRRLVFRCFQTKWVVIVIEPRIDHPQKHKDLPNLGISELPRFGAHYDCCAQGVGLFLQICFSGLSTYVGNTVFLFQYN